MKILQHWWGIPLLVFALAIILPSLFFYVFPVSAQNPLANMIAYSLSNILQWLAGMASGILLWLVGMLIQVSGYNGFINAQIVQVGWPLVRDVANMFYILVMLVMAFATMLKIEKYSMKALLPRLIFTAILVNFSKTIIGLIIDFGQVIMLTFVNGYAATAGGNFVQMFGLPSMTTMSVTKIPDNVQISVFASYLLAFVCLSISAVVVGVFVLVLLARIITLWILIVLSPLAFLLGTFPKGQDYYGKWWKELINNVISGPIVAFFLWLSLAVLGAGGTVGYDQFSGANNSIKIAEPADSQYVTNLGLSELGGIKQLTSLAVSIAMLLMGLSQIQELGVVGAGMASSAMSSMKSVASKAIKKAVIPAAVMATGGGVLGAVAKMTVLKGGLDMAAKMPVIGKTVQGMRKGMGAYGLGESGKLVKATMPITERVVKGAAMAGLGTTVGVVGAVPTAAVVAGGFAVGAAKGAFKGYQEGTGVLKGAGAGLKETGKQAAVYGVGAVTGLAGMGAGTLIGTAAVSGLDWVRSKGIGKGEGPFRWGMGKGKGKGKDNWLQNIAAATQSATSPISAAATQAEIAISKQEKSAASADTDVAHLSRASLISTANREPSEGSEIDKALVYKSRKQVISDSAARNSFISSFGDERFRELLDKHSELGDSVGLGEESRSTVGKLTSDQIQYQSPTELKTFQESLADEKAIKSKVSPSSLEHPNVAKAFESRRGQMSNAQQQKLDAGLAKANAQGAADAKRAPYETTVPSFAAKELKPEKVDRNDFEGKMNRQERRQHLKKIKSSSQALENTGYTAPDSTVPGDRGSLTPKGRQAIGDTVKDDGVPEWAKDLKAEAVFAKMPDLTISGLSAMTSALVKNATVGQILALRTKDMTANQAKLVAALHLAAIGNFEERGDAQAVADLRKALITPAYAGVNEHAVQIEDQITANGGTLAPVAEPAP